MFLTDYFLGITYFYKSALLTLYLQTHKYMHFTDIGSPVVFISVSNHIEKYTLDRSLQHHKSLAVIFSIPHYRYLDYFQYFVILTILNPRIIPTPVPGYDHLHRQISTVATQTFAIKLSLPVSKCHVSYMQYV